MQNYASVVDMLRDRHPRVPVYCIHPAVYRDCATHFVNGFPGRVLFAVKANDHPEVIRLLNQGGVVHFDCASVPEIAVVTSVCKEATCYFMVPTRLRGAAHTAYTEYGVRHFLLDHISGLAPLCDEIDMPSSVVFARMAVHHAAAMQDLSAKFGAPPDDIPDLLKAIAATGAEPALAFNVGSAVTSPAAYQHALAIAASVMQQLPFKLRLVDVGGGFPKSYPGFNVPPLSDYFNVFKEAKLPLASNGELMCEPGRALAARGLSAVVEVLLRKEERLYLNDGMYGIFWELRFKGHTRYAVKCYRDGKLMDGETGLFMLYGPTCDSTDVLPAAVPLPLDICAGDHLEFDSIGAYSLSGRTQFNGHYSDDIVCITGPNGTRA